MKPDKLTESVTALSKTLEVNTPEDISDEHLRWELYQLALEIEDCIPILLTTLEDEPDELVLSSVVILALTVRDASERPQWLATLPSDEAGDFARRRADELAILERLENGSSFQATEIESWTNWLQLRIAEQTNRRDIVQLLQQAGTTKRIRNVASSRLKFL